MPQPDLDHADRRDHRRRPRHRRRHRPGAARRRGHGSCISDRDETLLAATADELGVAGLSRSTCTDPDAVGSVRRRPSDPVDVLVNNAGIMPVGPFLVESRARSRARSSRSTPSGRSTAARDVRPADDRARAAGTSSTSPRPSAGSRWPAGRRTRPPSMRWSASPRRCARSWRRFGVDVSMVLPVIVQTDLSAGRRRDPRGAAGDARAGRRSDRRRDPTVRCPRPGRRAGASRWRGPPGAAATGPGRWASRATQGRQCADRPPTPPRGRRTRPRCAVAGRRGVTRGAGSDVRSPPARW